MSAALFSRHAGEGRTSLGTLGCSWVILGGYVPLDVGELLPDCYSFQKPLRLVHRPGVEQMT